MFDSRTRAITYGYASLMAERGRFSRRCVDYGHALLLTLFRPLEFLPIFSASSGDNLNLMKNNGGLSPHPPGGASVFVRKKYSPLVSGDVT
jgi:hypothetical protein